METRKKKRWSIAGIIAGAVAGCWFAAGLTLLLGDLFVPVGLPLVILGVIGLVLVIVFVRSAVEEIGKNTDD